MSCISFPLNRSRRRFLFFFFFIENTGAINKVMASRKLCWQFTCGLVDFVGFFKSL